MPNVPLTASDVKAILQKNGITSLDELANMIAEKSAGHPPIIDVSPAGKDGESWVIKAWKLSGKEDILPDHLGGDVIKHRINKGHSNGG